MLAVLGSRCLSESFSKLISRPGKSISHGHIRTQTDRERERGRERDIYMYIDMCVLVCIYTGIKEELDASHTRTTLSIAHVAAQRLKSKTVGQPCVRLGPHVEQLEELDGVPQLSRYNVLRNPETRMESNEEFCEDLKLRSPALQIIAHTMLEDLAF